MNKSKKKAIINFIKNIDENINVVFHNGALECDIEEETVYIGNQMADEEDNLFLDFVKELNSKCNYNAFILGILHEIGHIMTYDEELDNDRDEQYALMQVAHKLGLYDTNKLNKEYFKIPLELNATQWGIDFAMNNKKLMDKYNNIIIK